MFPWRSKRDAVAVHYQLRYVKWHIVQNRLTNMITNSSHKCWNEHFVWFECIYFTRNLQKWWVVNTECGSSHFPALKWVVYFGFFLRLIQMLNQVLKLSEYEMIKSLRFFFVSVRENYSYAFCYFTRPWVMRMPWCKIYNKWKSGTDISHAEMSSSLFDFDPKKFIIIWTVHCIHGIHC